MWKCKRCGEEVVLIETVNTTTTCSLTKNKKIRKINSRVAENWDTGYICSSDKCPNNERYFCSLKDIAEWEDDK